MGTEHPNINTFCLATCIYTQTYCSLLRFKLLQAAHSRMFHLIHYVKIKTLMTLTVELSIRVAWQNVIVLIWSSKHN